MKKEKAGFWKTHPLLKAITVLVGFFFVFYLLYFFYSINTPILAGIACLFYFFYYFVGGLYILGILYGIWADRRCHLKFFSFCLVFLILIICTIIFVFVSVYPSWKLNGHIVWVDIRSPIVFACAQILSVIGGYILSKIISYFARKDHKKEKTSI